MTGSGDLSCYRTLSQVLCDGDHTLERCQKVTETVLAPMVEYPRSHNPVLLQEVQENKTLEEKRGDSKHLVQSFGQSKGAR